MIERALAMSETLDDPGARSDVLNTAAFAAFLRGEDWRPYLEETLRIALESGAHAEAGRGYVNTLAYCSADFAFAESDRWWPEAIAYCEDNDLMTFATCLRGVRALTLLDECRWDEAISVTEPVFANNASPLNLLTSQVALGLIRARRGEPAATELLTAAAAAADGIAETNWIALTRLACAEDRWLDGDDTGARREIDRVRATLTLTDPDDDAPTAVWERRLQGTSRAFTEPQEPWAAWLRGDCQEAATRWDTLGCAYHAALALYDSGREEHLRDAVTRFDALGASAAAGRARQRMKDLGHRAVPTGARPSTREHPLGLTRRENEVLLLLCEGLTNDEIAVKLVVSPRTVDHHVSAVLTKVGVGSRGAAAAQARQLGLVPATT